MTEEYKAAEQAAAEAYAKGNMQEYRIHKKEILEAIARGEDHCSCESPCGIHGNCIQCVATHRAHRQHLPACFSQMVNERLYSLSELTEHTLAETLQETRKM